MTAPAPITPRITDPFVIVDASAGTGKTYTLSSRMIRALLHRGRDADPAGVLATTFTRKAAGEITERVFRRLLEGWRDPAALARLHDETHHPLQPADCAGAAASLACRMDRLRIMTIDALLARLARASAPELDLAPGWTVGNEADLANLQRSAIEATLRDGDPTQTQILVRSLSRNPLSRQIHGALERAVKDVHATFRAGGDPGLWSVIAPTGDPLDADALRHALDDIRSAPLPQTSKGGPDQRFAKARDSLLSVIEQQAWDKLVCEGLAASLLAEGTYYAIALPADLASAIRPVLAHATWHILSRLQARNRAVASLLGRYDALVWNLRRRAGLLSFDDVPRLLVEAEVTGRLTDLWFRLDSTIDELLIDEAQDTSLMQFWLIQPMLAEMLAGGDRERGVLIVGDVKQSLYGWRQAEAQLLPAIGATWPILKKQSLTQSYRSSQVVLDAVNTVFGSLDGHAALASREGATAAGRRFARLFHKHTSAPSAGGPTGPGMVRLRAHPLLDPDAERPKADRVTGTLQAVTELLAQAAAGGVRIDIGVLVRANKPIRPIVAALRAAGIDASEEGGAPLADDPGVAAILSLLHWADHPTDELALYHIAMSPIGAALGWNGVPTRPKARTHASALRRMLSARGYAPVLERLANRAARHLTASSNERVDQLIEMAREFDTRGSLRPAEFVALACDRRVGRPGGGQVRVMTIHRAKGLEFDAVVLPDLDRTWSPSGKGAMLCRASVLEPASAASLSVSAGVARVHPLLLEMVHQRDERQVFEELCGLYVAMTRARRALVMLIEPFNEPSGKSGSLPLKASGILRGSLPIDTGGHAPDPGARPWFAGLPRAAARSAGHPQETPTSSPSPPTIELRLAPPAPRSLRRAQIVSPSSMEGGGTIDLGRRLSLDDSGGRDVGTAAHAMLATIGWLDDGQPSESSLIAAGRAAGGSNHAVQTALGIVQRALVGRPADCLRRAWHSAPRPAASDPHTRLDLRREWRFLHEDESDGQARLVSGIVDRLVIRWDGGTAVGADVIDYKTDRLGPTDGAATGRTADLTERTAYYAPQIRAYASGIARMFGLSPTQVRGALVFLTADTIVIV